MELFWRTHWVEESDGEAMAGFETIEIGGQRERETVQIQPSFAAQNIPKVGSSRLGFLLSLLSSSLSFFTFYLPFFLGRTSDTDVPKLVDL